MREKERERVVTNDAFVEFLFIVFELLSYIRNNDYIPFSIP